MDDEVGSDMFRQLQDTFRQALRQFAESHSNFQVLRSIPDQSQAKIHTLYVLDSSFNPPSKAHALLVERAIRHDNGTQPTRVMLLLATENADKKPKPAALEDRVAMMTIMAESLQQSTSIPVDVAVTKKPFFVDKAKSIDDAAIYGNIEQVHLIGYDTITRIFDSKYYPADKKLRVLEPFLDKHRLRVTYRPGDQCGSKEDQDRYLASIEDGSREDEGMKSEWRRKIEMVDDARDGVGISSTEARKAKVEGREEDIAKYVQDDIARYVVDMNLYTEPGAEKK